MARQHWLIKSEPSVYAFERLQRDGGTSWDGVRNYEARNHLRAMKRGDLVLFYHSNEGKRIVGVAKVSREAFADPTASGEDWSAVGIEPVKALAHPVSLDDLRADPVLAKMELFRRTRLSVTPVTKDQYDTVLELARRAPAPPSSATPPARQDPATPPARQDPATPPARQDPATPRARPDPSTRSRR